MWYKEWFGRDEYELVYQDRDDAEAERVVDLIERVTDLAPGATVLDVACGRGRHARALARRGYRVTGYDLSERALRTARERTERAGLDVRYVRGDMREPLCHHCFDAVVNLFTAFGYFESDADHRQAIQAMGTTLTPNGWFVQDYLNAPFVEENLVAEDRRCTDGIEIVQQRWIDAGRIVKRITFHDNGSTRTFHESVRLLTLDDFRTFYDEAGLDLVETFGDYDGSPYGEEAPRLILVARKR